MRLLLLALLLLPPIAGVAHAAPEPSPPGPFDVEALVARMPPFTVDGLLLDRGVPVGTASVEVSVHEQGRRFTWVERVQEGRGLAASRTALAVQHDALGRATRTEVTRDGASRIWQQLGAGRTEVSACEGAVCEVLGVIEGGGVLPELSLMVLLFGEPPAGARWEGWVLSLQTGEPALTTLIADETPLPSGARRTLVSGASTWEAVHEDGALVEMTLPSGRTLRPLEGPVQDAWEVLESRASATRAALRFLLAWSRGGWSAAAEHAQFAEPSVIREWKIALHEWSSQDGARAPGEAAGEALAARLVQAEVRRSVGGWSFRLPSDGGPGLVLTVAEDGLGQRVSDVRAAAPPP